MKQAGAFKEPAFVSKFWGLSMTLGCLCPVLGSLSDSGVIFWGQFELLAFLPNASVSHFGVSV